MQKKLTKSSDKMLAGVCGGIADYLEIDPTLVRVGYAGLTFLTGFMLGLVLYLILWVVMPSEPA